jgi:hypothetical protein
MCNKRKFLFLILSAIIGLAFSWHLTFADRIEIAPGIYGDVSPEEKEKLIKANEERLNSPDVSAEEKQEIQKRIEELKTSPSAAPAGAGGAGGNLPGLIEGGVRKNFVSFLNWFYLFLLSAAAVLAVVMIVAAGVIWAGSMGSEAAIRDAQDKIRNAIIGLIIAFAAWLILNTINPDLVKLRGEADRNFQFSMTQFLNHKSNL